MPRGNERDDSRGGIGLGGPQDGPVGGRESHRQQDDPGATAGADTAEIGEGRQRHSGGSSRDSEKMS